MPNTFFTSDNHFGQTGILKVGMVRPRPFASIEDHDEALIRAWKAVVPPTDIVWHLGDFACTCQVGSPRRALPGGTGLEPVVREKRFTQSTIAFEGRSITHSPVRTMFIAVWETASKPIIACHPSQKTDEIGASLKDPSGSMVLFRTKGGAKLKNSRLDRPMR